jgi:IS605 OrfB family transposase
MGIDVGVNAPATVHVRVDGSPQQWAQWVGNGRELLASRNVIRNEIRRIVRGLRAKYSGLVGKARDGARERLRDLRRKEKRVIKTASQKIAAHIAEIAKRNGAGTWQLEDLSEGIKDEEPWLARNWAPGTLLHALRWNAQKIGAVIVEVNPAHTSQRCSNCGHIDPQNRPKGKEGAKFFECVKCGHSEDADKNAARNLSTPGISDLISKWLEVNKS